MRPTLKTLALAAVALALLVLNLVDPGSTPGTSSQLRIIPPVPAADATRIELSTASEKIQLDKDPQTGRWALSAPLEHPADQRLVAAVLQPFRAESTVDVRIDTGNLGDYGLDASSGVVVEIFAQADSPKVSLTVGNDAPGGTSFIRLSGDDAVYRARVGGRSRFVRSASEWRNRVVLDFTEDEVQGVSVKPPVGDVVHISRSPDLAEGQTAGAWIVDPDPGWGLDSAGLQAMVSALGELRAEEILGDDFEGGFSPPAVELTVVRNDGTEQGMAVGSVVKDGLAHVRVTGGAAVYAVPVAPLKRFLALTAGIQQDRTIFSVARQDMAKIILWQGRTSVEVAPDPDSGVWRILSPQGLTSDIADINWALSQLSRLQADGRAEGVSLVAGGVVPPNMVFEVQRHDGTHEAIYVGRTREIEGRSYYMIARQNTKDVLLIAADRITRLRRAFGQQ
jgi:hypothetical protein